MTTVEYLDQIRRIDRIAANRLRDLKENIRRVRDEVIGLTGVTYDSDKVQSYGNSDPTSKPAILLASMEQDVNRSVNAMMTLRRNIVSQIEEIEDTSQYDMLFKHFVLHVSIGRFARECGMSWRQANTLYDKALESFESMFGNLYLEEEKKWF